MKIRRSTYQGVFEYKIGVLPQLCFWRVMVGLSKILEGLVSVLSLGFIFTDLWTLHAIEKAVRLEWENNEEWKIK